MTFNNYYDIIILNKKRHVKKSFTKGSYFMKLKHRFKKLCSQAGASAVVFAMLFVMLPVSAFSAFASASSESVQTGPTDYALTNDEMSMSGTNSFGTMLTNTIQTYNNGMYDNSYSEAYAVTNVQISGRTAKVEYSAVKDCELVVALYSDDGEKLLCSASKMVSAGETITGFSFSDTLPTYYLIKAFLLDKKNHSPLSKLYTSELYTEQIQNLKTKTIDDFAGKEILNLDSSNTTNFAVYNDDVVFLEQSGQKNTYDKAASNTDAGIYVFNNADNSIRSLQVGDVFSYRNSDEVIIIKIASIDITQKNDGSYTVTLREGSVDMNQVFDFVKIENNGRLNDYSFDDSVADEEVTPLNISESEAYSTNSANTISQKNYGIVDLSGQIDYAFKPVHIKPKKESDNPHLNGAFKGEFDLYSKYSISVKLYLSWSYSYLEFKVDHECTLKGEIESELSLKSVALFKVELMPVWGVKVGFVPKLSCEFTVKATIELGFSQTEGFNFSTKEGYRDLSTAPKLDFGLEVEGKIFIGIDLEPYVEIVNDHIAKLSVEGSVGFTITGKNSFLPESQDVNADELHLCKMLCIDGDVSFQAELKASLTLFGKTHPSGEIAATGTIKLCDWYYSLDYTDFGFNATCSHIGYKVSINVVDENNHSIEGAELSYKQGDSDETVLGNTDANGRFIAHLPDGKYTIIAKKDNLCKEQNITVSSKPTSVSFALFDDDSNDPSDPTIEYGNPVAAGQCGDNATYTLYDNGLLEINGSGRMYDYSNAAATNEGGIPSPFGEFDAGYYDDYPNHARIVRICGVNYIGAAAFDSMGNNLDEVYISSSVKEIGLGAFCNSSVSKVTIAGHGLMTVGESAFAGCYYLKDIQLPSSVTTIGYCAFQGGFYSSGLKSITIPKSVATIGWGAFDECDLETVYYTGSESEWNNIQIGSNNDELINANIIYNYSGNSPSPNPTNEIAVHSADTDTSGIQTASYVDLIPGQDYLFAVVKSDTCNDLFAPENLLYIDQRTADSNGKLTVKYRQRVDYQGALVKLFGASKLELGDAVITAGKLFYNGTTQSPAITVTLYGKRLSEGADYIISGTTEAVEPGSYDFIVTGVGEYTGAVQSSFEIVSTDAKLNLNDISMLAGTTFTPKTFLYPADSGETVTWSSANESIATVSSTGEITAVAKGKTVITVKTQGGKYDTIRVNVVDKTKPTASIILRQPTQSLLIKRSNMHPTATLSAVIVGGSGGKTWCSDDINVVTVTKAGKLTAIAAGKTNVYCRTEDGTTSEPCQVTVRNYRIDCTSQSDEHMIGNTVYLLEGQTCELTVNFTNYHHGKPSWKSSNAKVVSVNDGRITGLKKGSATVYITDTAKNSDSVKVIVVKPSEGVSVSPKKTAVYVGKTKQLKAVLGTKDSNDPVFWSSDNPSVATVSSKGVVKGTGQGTTTITATTFSGKTAKAVVTVRTKTTALEFTETVSALYMNGNTGRFTVRIVSPANSNDTITWSTGNKKILSIVSTSPDGKTIVIKSGTKGSTTVTAKAGGGEKITWRVTSVNQPAQSITLNRYSASLYVGSSLSLKAKQILPRGCNDVILWRSSNPEIATVDANGKVTGKAQGEVTIFADSFGGIKNSVDVTVRAKATALEFTDKVSALYMGGETGTFTVRITAPENSNDTITWSTGNKKIISIEEISDDGKTITVKSGIKGSTAITAKAGSGKKITCNVTSVNQPAESVKLNRENVQLYVGAALSVSASVLPKGCNDAVSWQSADPSVATVNAQGRIKAISQGTTEIYAETFGGKRSRVFVKVLTKATAISVDRTSVKVGINGSVTLNATVAPEGCNDIVTWISGNKSIVTVTPLSEGRSAIVNGIKAGTATVTARTGSGKTKAIKVTVSKDMPMTNNLLLTLWGEESDREFLTQVSNQWAEEYAASHAEYDSVCVNIVSKNESSAAYDILNNSSLSVDVFGISSDSLSNLVSANLLKKLPDSAVSSAHSVVGNASLDSALYGGNYYGVPYSSNVSTILYYNKSLYTQDEVKNLNTMLQKDLGDKVNLIADIENSNHAIDWFGTAGSQLYMGGDKSVNTLNSSESVAMMKWLLSQTQLGKIKHVYFADAPAVMRDSMAGAALDDWWAKASYESALGGNLGISELPSVTVTGVVSNRHMSCFASYNLLVVKSDTKYPDASLALMQYLTSANSQLKRYNMTGRVPTAQSLSSDSAITSSAIVVSQLKQSNYSVIRQNQLLGDSQYWTLIPDFMGGMVSHPFADSTIEYYRDQGYSDDEIEAMQAPTLTEDQVKPKLDQLVSQMQQNVGA